MAAAWYDDPDRMLAPRGKLTGDQRAWRRVARKRQSYYPRAFWAGLEGFVWQPERWGWPSIGEDDIYQAYLSGLDERRRQRLNDRVIYALVWLARKLAPKTTELAGQGRERWRAWYEGRDR